MSTDYAYIAGLIDGEGSIIIAKGKEKRPDGRTRIRYRARIKISMRDKGSLEFTRKVFPSNILKTNRKIGGIYSIAYSVIKGEELLNKVSPYLQVKKDQSEVFQAFNKSAGNRSKQECESLYQQSKQLKLKNATNYNLVNPYFNKTINATPEDLAYIAAIVDGEGHLGIYKALRHNRQQIKIILHFCLSMNNLEALQFIANRFGGYIATPKNRHIYAQKRIKP